jgi:DNA (cytosine-5)-methyltransferase 1|nr:helix-turn-helix transcriptional regulator [uncultured Oscillibacter sp.]
MVSYDPLWITLVKKKMKKKDLYKIVSSATVARMGRGDYVSLEVIDKICVALDCGIGDVVMRDYCTEKSPDA